MLKKFLNSTTGKIALSITAAALTDAVCVLGTKVYRICKDTKIKEAAMKCEEE